MSAPTMNRAMTPGRRAFLTTLLAERVHAYGTVDLDTVDDPSTMITCLLSCDRVPAPPVVIDTVAVAKGDVVMLSDGTVVRVKISGSGNLYGMARTPDATGFEYAGSIARMRMTGARRLTMAEALTLSAAWGECVRCGRTLTDPNSVAAGIGPVCRKAFDY